MTTPLDSEDIKILYEEKSVGHTLYTFLNGLSIHSIFIPSLVKNAKQLFSKEDKWPFFKNNKKKKLRKMRFSLHSLSI